MRPEVSRYCVVQDTALSQCAGYHIAERLHCTHGDLRAATWCPALDRDQHVRARARRRALASRHTGCGVFLQCCALQYAACRRRYPGCLQRYERTSASAAAGAVIKRPRCPAYHRCHARYGVALQPAQRWTPARRATLPPIAMQAASVAPGGWRILTPSAWPPQQRCCVARVTVADPSAQPRDSCCAREYSSHTAEQALVPLPL